MNRKFKIFGWTWLLIASFYLLWLISCWPGVIGPDAYAVILESETNREFKSGKTIAWFLFVDAFYKPTKLVEVPIIAQILLSSLIYSRILTWVFEARYFKTFIYCLLFIVLAPGLVLYTSSLYPDAMFATTMTGLLFECWLIHKKQKIGIASTLVLLACIPFALFSRANGITNLIPLLVLCITLCKVERGKILLITGAWFCAATVASIRLPSGDAMGTIYPLVAFETVGFLEKRPMGLWEMDEPRISPKSLAALESKGKTKSEILEYYDHYYWDPLIFPENGPRLLHLDPKQKKVLVREFFKYNLWHNFPAFSASRINVFLFATLANGGIPFPPKITEVFLPLIKSKSVINKYDAPTNTFFKDWIFLTHKYRWFLWAPWLGIFLIPLTLIYFTNKKRKFEAIISLSFFVQLGGIFLFSIAGEYRYLLSIFTAPITLLPIYLSTRIKSMQEA